MKTRTDQARAFVRSRIDAFGRELRSMPEVVELRAGEGDGGSPVLAGHAAVFNKETNIANIFREVIAPGAFSKTIKEADVRHLFNHDPNWVLARTKNGSLILSEDKEGLAFAATLNMVDPQAVSVKAKVERGDVTQSSFAFRVIKEEWFEPDDPDSGELPLRTIKEARLYDTSSVTYPAYEEADTYLRGVGLDILGEALGINDDDRAIILRALALGDTLEAEMEPVLRDASKALCALAGTCNTPEAATRTSTTDTITITVAGSTSNWPPELSGSYIVIDDRAGDEPLKDEQPNSEQARLQLRMRAIARQKGLDL